ncbi:hypothetical protein JTB14_008296 [Gonioctena quinquepunctata]|nr:hypothetical protein JTB14_008296 [Gonioctena quinquepunctata]
MFRVVLLLLSCRVLQGKICQSIEVRNSVINLSQLENCTEIAGYLSILLIDKVNVSEFDDYVFPELTSISGYLMFYDVFNFTSVGKLFPNLRIIRGMELFADYALVLHDLPDLREARESSHEFQPRICGAYVDMGPSASGRLLMFRIRGQP